MESERAAVILPSPLSVIRIVWQKNTIAVLLLFAMGSLAQAADWGLMARVKDFSVSPRQLGVNLEWSAVPGASGYEIQRSSTPHGPFTLLQNRFPQFTIYNDFIGLSDVHYYYRVRSLKSDEKGRVQHSIWSRVLEGTSEGLNTYRLLTEVQKSSFDYFYHCGHPVSGLARLSMRRDPDICAIGASGMGFFNLGVGVKRGFITRREATERALLELKFLSENTQRFHGAFPHLVNGQTGRVIQFGPYDDGADIVETALLMEGVLFAREFFSGPDPDEAEIRSLADSLWREVEWDWFLSRDRQKPVLIWHWSPHYGWKINLHVEGFNECQIVYVLAMASPTHPIGAAAYWQGWEGPTYTTNRTEFGIPLVLGNIRAVTPPIFMAHYSYLGMDPRQIRFHGRTYFDHFRDFCQVQIRYAQSKSNVFKGYGPLWGISASAGPDGYRVFSPGMQDNGTLTPTAAISSMPYTPAESLSCLVQMYQHYGARLWGPLGFYDSFNLTRDWVSKTYLCIDEGPIAPMIENYRSGFCWNIFMKCGEIKPVLKVLNDGDAGR